MRILISGGGTAGHINPALAIIGYARKMEEDLEVLYVGKVDGMEQRLVTKAGYNMETIEISGFSRKITPKGLRHNIKTLKLINESQKKSQKIIEDFDPDICIGTGGYVSGPVIKQAQKMNIPTLIHEQNAFPGVTNKMLSRKASVVMLAVEDARQYMSPKATFEVVGNPLRQDILRADKQKAREKLGLDERPVILSFGGSLGARAINEAMAEVIKKTCKDDEYQHIHGYGQYGKWFEKRLKESGVDIKAHKNLMINEYINNMSDCMAAADLVICRSGAITISELQAMKKASILIPSPNVAENHQYHNAMALVNRQAADILEEKNLTGKALYEKIENILSDKKLLKRLGENAGEMAILDSNERIYNIIKRESLKR
ncbi:MAG: undecaprenyldiphospho-muramoylpentapeptide beta-N-acetylglucosaminyltransferase [Clostridia bacterium]|nr:undecaprenyldiphospho-muramoylpentapeptide beta-N-acetylglucosaminyltransferase [Clostridia bacterium]